MIHCQPSSEGSGLNLHSNSPKKGLDIDLNQEYVPSSSHSGSISHEERQDLSSPAVEQHQPSKQQEYTYRPRKAESQYSQKPSALHTRKMMKFIRENSKVAFDAYREKEKDRLSYLKQKQKESTKQNGTSMRAYDRRLKEARVKIKEGTANKEEKEFVEKKNQYFRERRVKMKKAGTMRKQVSKMQVARKKAKEGTATKEHLAMIEKKRASDRERYQRKKDKLAS